MEVPEVGGLGGSQSTGDFDTKGISFTADLYHAKEIARALKEAVGIANGTYDWRDVLHWASADGIDEEDLLSGIPGGQRRKDQHGISYRSKGDKDSPAGAFGMYQAYLAYSKRYNPVFFGVDVEDFAAYDESDVGIVAAQVSMTDPRIIYLGAMEEYRVPRSAVLEIVGPRIAKVYHGSLNLYATADPEMSGLGHHVGTLDQAIDRLRTKLYSDERGQSMDDVEYDEPIYVYEYDVDPKNLVQMPDMGVWKPWEVYDNLLTRGLIDAADERTEDTAEEDDATFTAWQEAVDPAAWRDPVEEHEEYAFDEVVGDWEEESPEFSPDMFGHIREQLKQRGYDGIVYENRYEDAYGRKPSGASYILWTLPEARTIELTSETSKAAR